MDWKVVGQSLATIAPSAGAILGGLIPFPGGSLIGQKFGEIIARQFGVAPTPQAVAGAIAANPNEVVLAKIEAATAQARAEIQGFVDFERAVLHAIEVSLEQTGATMRQEAAGRVQLALQGIREHWFFTAGRPASLWVFNAVNLVFGLMLCWATGKTAWMSPDPLKVLTEAWPLFLAYFGPLGLVNGIYINSRGQVQRAAIENNAPMPNATAPKPAAKK